MLLNCWQACWCCNFRVHYLTVLFAFGVLPSAIVMCCV
jgi:hypothetical protein